jgi:hypothetical protein
VQIVAESKALTYRGTDILLLGVGVINVTDKLRFADGDDDEVSRLGRCSKYGIRRLNKHVSEQIVEARGGMEAVPEQVVSCICTGANAFFVAQNCCLQIPCSAAGFSRLIKACSSRAEEMWCKKLELTGLIILVDFA